MHGDGGLQSDVEDVVDVVLREGPALPAAQGPAEVAVTVGGLLSQGAADGWHRGQCRGQSRGTGHPPPSAIRLSGTGRSDCSLTREWEVSPGAHSPTTDPQPAFHCSMPSGRCPPNDGSRCEADLRNAAGGSGSPPAGDHADPASRRRVDDVGVLCERSCRWRRAKHSAGRGESLRFAGQFSSSLLYLPYFAAVLAANEALTNSGAGLSPAVMLVGVTGFEPAASSSRTHRVRGFRWFFEAARRLGHHPVRLRGDFGVSGCGWSD